MLDGNFFQSIWDLAENLIKVIGSVWAWLSEPLSIDVPLLSNIPLIGSWFEWSLEYSPLQLLGVGISLLLILWVVKNLIPLG